MQRVKIRVTNGKAHVQRPPGRPQTPSGKRNYYRGRISKSQHRQTVLMQKALAHPEQVDKKGRVNPRIHPGKRQLVAEIKQARQAAGMTMFPFMMGGADVAAQSFSILPMIP